MSLLNISFIAAIPAIIGGLIVSIPIWKIQKYFLSKRDYYRNSPNEIFGMKFYPVATIFLFVAGVIYVYLKDKFNL